MSFESNIPGLIAHLKENAYQPELHKESKQVFVLFSFENHEMPLFFLFRPESKLLQMISYLPYTLTEKGLGESARLLHLLNRDLDMPGFGMDEEAKLMFYRCSIPCLEERIDKTLFDLYLGTARMACRTFMHVIGLVVSGSVAVNEILKRAEKHA
jgi:hypothetical protein